MSAHARIRTYLLTLLTVLGVSINLHAAEAPKQALKLKTVVLDAGHGGTDPGAISKDGKTKEKDLTLKLSKLVGKKINDKYPDIKVVYTRPEDKFVTLEDRANIANKNQANLFISIHINANNSVTPDGFSTHILGESSKKNTDLWAYNMNVCQRENSVILLEDDYTTKYQGFDPKDPESFIFFHLMQNAFYDQSVLFAADVQAELEKTSSFQHNRGIHQDPFYVLWKTTMPSVLIENGFISNQKDLAVLRTDEGLEKIAEGIFRAFVKFKDRYDGSTDFEKMTATPQKQAPEQVAKPTERPAAEKPVEKPAEKVTSEPVAKPAAEPSKDTAVKTVDPSVQPALLYGIQVVVTSKDMTSDDPFFCGYPVVRHKVGNLYKYIICEQESEVDVKKSFVEAVKKFPDSFMVKIEGEKFTFWGRRP